LTLLGYVSYRQLPVELLPNAELPLLVVFVMSYQETDPDYLETRAIIPIEGAIGALPGIERIESVARQRSGSVWVYYNQNTGMKYAYLKLQAKINEIRAGLPEGLVVEVVRFDTEERGNEYMTLQVRGGGGLDRVRSIVDRTVLGRLESMDGVAKVEIFGGREKAVEVILDEEACRAHGITPAEIPALIMRNGQNNTFVGHVAGGDKRYFVSVLTEYADIRELENIVVRERGSVLLRDVADVYFGVKQESSISRINGKEALTIRLSRESQVNLIALSNATRAVIDELNARLRTQDVEVVVQHDSAGYIRENIDTIVRLALIGGLLAVAILWMFLGNLRLVLVVALAIPISVFTAFNFFYAFGVSINTLTLIGIALAIGMLLDNSIVVLENIYRHAAAGAGRDEAVVNGTREVWRSIVAATLTTITVFLPFVFSPVATLRLIGRHIGVSIISTLLLSLVVALLLVPMVAHSVLKGGVGGTTRFQLLTRRSRALQVYNLLLKTGLRFPARTIIGCLVIFFVSIFICLAVSITVPQEAETEEMALYVNMPRGATLEVTDGAVTELEKLLGGVAEIQDVSSEIGEESATVRVTLKDGYSDIANRTYADIKADIRGRVGNFTAADVSFEAPLAGGGFERGGGGMGGGEGAGLMRMLGIGQREEKVVVRGSDFPTMVSVAENVRFYLRNVSSISESELNISENSPEIHLVYDTQLMSHYGVTMRQVAEELRAFEGEFTSDRLKYKQGVDEYDIVIRRPGGSGETGAKTIDDLRRLPIAGEGGGTYELQNLSRILYAYGKTNVRRVNQERHVEVRYEFADEVNESKSLLETARLDVDAVVASMKVPPGIALDVIHDDTEYGEYLFLIAVAFVLIYMILASVFESLAAPAVIMFTIPLAAAGSFWALIFTKTSLFTAYTITGFLILLGIVVNNGILLIDYTRILRGRGNRRVRALMTAGQARLRPILITAVTTIVGMLPLAMGKVGESMISGAPFAVTVIGGLSLSTLFTLVLIPVVYSGLESALQWMRQLRMPVKTVQLVIFLVGCWYIYDGIDRLIWKLAALVSLVFLIPGATYFLMASLRRARSELIAPGESIRIVIKNLTKVYDQDARFVREWKKGKRFSERAFRDGAGAPESRGGWNGPVHGGSAGAPGRRFGAFVWQLPVLGFSIFFVYFYLHSLFWAFVLSHMVYALMLVVWRPFRGLLDERSAAGGAAPGRPARLVTGTIIWGVPLFNVAFFYWEWRNTAVAIFIGCIWYFVLSVYRIAQRLHGRNVAVERMTGRFARITKALYRAILLVPVIGRKKRPLRALDRVSVEITHGMFGLLGPNGAGKTTLMRIICGILDQSYGRVWINGIDTRKKREELQGLIGYLPQEFGTYENLTAYEFLNYQAMLKNLMDAEQRERMIEYALSAVHIEEHRNRRIGTFSGGMKQRIGIAQTLLHLPRILVVDEPTAGLDPRERIRFRNLLVELSRERVVIFSTHIIEDISSSCNQVAVLNEGALRYLGPPARMTEIARGHVWQFHVPANEFERVRERFLVVHHMRDGDHVRVRCLAGNQPAADALGVNPTLEDAYLWLLRSGPAGVSGEESEDRI
ncbi:MAG TPA: efflux RND transporter permease subunit, partial [Patescibacteria group bacterium]|nr:efflux RND transporter permease subunit [Patescibacteria group bacterium]